MNREYAIGFMTFIFTALPISDMMGKYHTFPCFLPYNMPFIIDCNWRWAHFEADVRSVPRYRQLVFWENSLWPGGIGYVIKF